MDWTAGYASDIQYTAGFYQEQSPHYLNFVCALNEIEPVPLEQGFSYFELGFGRGVTVNLMAAAYPQGRFYAADFNPAHVAGARGIAASAGLSNLTLLENSFAELADGAVPDLPQFDFITLHGIYTWVTAENRQHIVNFIARYLKPGGIVYVSYNALPGWSAILPLQRLLVEWGDAHPNRSDVQVAEAATYIKQVADAGAGYFATHPSTKVRLDGLQTMNRQYLVHEYMHKHWQPLYHADVARDLAGAKLDYAGSADLPQVYTKLYLSEERQALCQRQPDPAMRETMKDFFVSTSFRKDVFVRGVRRMGMLRRAEWLAQSGAVLSVPRNEVNLALKLSFGEVNGAAAVFDPVCDALAQGPHTLQQLQALPSLQGQAFENVLQAVALLSATGQAILFPAGGPGAEAAPAQRLNRQLAGGVRYGDEYQALCSPLLGNGLTLNYVERLLYWVLSELPGEENASVLAQAAWQVLQAQGRRMVKEGQPVESADDNLRMLRDEISLILYDKLPHWRRLRLL